MPLQKHIASSNGNEVKVLLSRKSSIAHISGFRMHNQNVFGVLGTALRSVSGRIDLALEMWKIGWVPNNTSIGPFIINLDGD